MKKILLASTALIATAGVAAADISLSGSGRFGLSYLEGREDAGARDDTVLYSRLRINIDASTETDGGVEFGARLRIQALNDADNNEQSAATLNGARFSVAYGGLEVYVGNTGGAIDNMKFRSGNEPGALFEAGQGVARNYGGFGYSSGGDGANALYTTYAVGDVLVGAGYDDTATGEEVDAFITYTMGNFGATLAYGQRTATGEDDEDTFILGLDYNVGDLNLTAIIGDEDVNGAGTTTDATLSDTFYGISANYAISSATAIQFAYGDGSGSADTDNVGIGATHSLGGGVTLAGGAGQVGDDTYASVGVRLNF